MAILGLLIQQPDTPSGVKDRLSQEFPHGRWSRNIVYGNMPKLARRGLICRVQEGEEGDLWKATQRGAAEFKKWLSRAAAAPPPRRDPRLLWLEHSDESEQPEMLRVVRAVEATVRAEFAAAQTRLNTERAAGSFGPSDGSDWQGRMHYAVLKLEVLGCGARLLEMKKLIETIENKGIELHSETEVDGDG
jgi:hypothetical protein